METFTVTLKHKSTHKWSERYDAEDSDAPVKNIYLLKTALTPGTVRPNTVKVTVEDAD